MSSSDFRSIALSLRNTLNFQYYKLAGLIENGRYNVEAHQYLVTQALQELELKLEQSSDVKHLVQILNVLEDPDQFEFVSIEEDSTGWTIEASDGYLTYEDQRCFVESGVFALDPYIVGSDGLINTLERREYKVSCAIAKETWLLLTEEN